MGLLGTRICKQFAQIYLKGSNSCVLIMPRDLKSSPYLSSRSITLLRTDWPRDSRSTSKTGPTQISTQLIFTHWRTSQRCLSRLSSLRMIKAAQPHKPTLLRTDFQLCRPTTPYPMKHTYLPLRTSFTSQSVLKTSLKSLSLAIVLWWLRSPASPFWWLLISWWASDCRSIFSSFWLKIVYVSRVFSAVNFILFLFSLIEDY